MTPASTHDLLATCSIVNALVERSASGFVAFDRELRVELASRELSNLLGEIVPGRPLEGGSPQVTVIAALAARVRDGKLPCFDVPLGGGLVASAYPVEYGGEVVGVGCVLDTADRDSLDSLDDTPFAIAVFGGPEQRERVTNRAWRARVTVPLSDVVRTLLDRVYATHTPVPFEAVVLRQEPVSGEPTYTGVVAPLRSALGVVHGVVVVCSEAVARSRAWLAPRVTSGLVGAPQGALFDDIHPDDRAACTAALARASRLGTSCQAKARLGLADGSYRWQRVSCSLDPNGERWYVTMTDEADCGEDDGTRRDDRARDQFLASISHELRSPITTLLLWEKVLRDAPDDAELRARALDAIHESATTQARLVDDLLDVARAISGKLRVDLRVLDIGRALEGAIDDEGPSAHAKHQHIERDIHPHLGLVSADVARLRQIFRNLLSNAIKFTDEGGTIRVSARTDERHVVIDVTDSGIGIAPEFLSRIFEPFSQAESSRSPAGLGLGLAISYQLAIAHGGDLTARSPGLGRGSTFSLSLPVSTHRASTPVPIGPAMRMSGMRVLVVDDDRRVLEAMQVLLQHAGATVDIAASVELGFETLQRTAPDVVLSDLSMPDEDGYAFVRRVRTLAGAIGGVPMVALTGHATQADRARALAAGFDLYLTKPVDVDRLIATVVQIIAARRE